MCDDATGSTCDGYESGLRRLTDSRLTMTGRRFSLQTVFAARSRLACGTGRGSICHLISRSRLSSVGPSAVYHHRGSKRSGSPPTQLRSVGLANRVLRPHCELRSEGLSASRTSCSKTSDCAPEPSAFARSPTSASQAVPSGSEAQSRALRLSSASKVLK